MDLDSVSVESFVRDRNKYFKENTMTNNRLTSGLYDVCGVYMLTNIFSHKCYIGSSVNIGGRIIQHFKKTNKNCNVDIKKDLEAYGKDSFTVQLLYQCKPTDRKEKEQYFLDLYVEKLGEDGLYNRSLNTKSNIGCAYNQKIYNFVHVSGKTFTGTQYDLRIKEQTLKPYQTSRLCSGYSPIVKGWSIKTE
jgi:predicted GIY-YIG superfamily endonuclease